MTEETDRLHSDLVASQIEAKNLQEDSSYCQQRVREYAMSDETDRLRSSLLASQMEAENPRQGYVSKVIIRCSSRDIECPLLVA